MQVVAFVVFEKYICGQFGQSVMPQLARLLYSPGLHAEHAELPP